MKLSEILESALTSAWQRYQRDETVTDAVPEPINAAITINDRYSG